MCVKNHFSIVLLSISLSIIGGFIVQYIPLNLNPVHSYPSLSIHTQYPNASPEEVERTLTKPLEAALSLIRGIDKISSISSKGQSEITVLLSDVNDIDMIRFEISTKIRQIYPKQPPVVRYPKISMNQPTESNLQRPILIYSLYGEESREAIYSHAVNVVVPYLSGANGLLNIAVTGGSQPEWRIAYDAERLAQYKINSDAIRARVFGSLDNTALGSTRDGNYNYYSILTAEAIVDLPSTIIDTLPRNVGIIKLSDVAYISSCETEPTSLYRINGQENIRLSFIAESTANHLVLAKELKANIQGLELSEGYQLMKEYDSTEYIQEELDKIKLRSLWSLSLLLLFVILVYRRIKHLLIIMLGLLVNLGISFIFYYLLDVQLNLYALAAITVSFGIIIDNLIVVIHHYTVHQNLTVASSLVSATLTTIASIIVIWFLPEEWQWNLIDFAKVIAINLAVSLIVSIIFIPAIIDLMSYHKSSASQRNYRFSIRLNAIYRKALLILVRYRKSFGLFTILLFGIPVFLLPTKVKDMEWYNSSLGNEWYVEHVRPHVNKYLGGSLRLFLYYVYEGSSFRKNEETKLYVNASLPLGSTLEQMNEFMQRVETYLANYEHKIKYYLTSISGPERASIEINFRNDGDASFAFLLKNRLQLFAVDQGGVEWSIYGLGKGFSNASGSMPPRYRLRLKGYNQEQLNILGNEFASLLTKHPRIKEVDTQASINWWEKDVEEFNLTVNQELLYTSGADMTDLPDMLASYNQDVNYIGYTTDNHPVNLIDSRQANNDLWKLENTYIQRDSIPVLFSSFAEIKRIKGQASIHKEDQQYLQQLEWEYTGSARFGQKYLDECLIDFQTSLPLGYTVDQQTYSFGSKKAKKQYQLLLLIIGIIFFICSIHFESFRMAISIVSMIPISFTGIFLTFYWFDFPFDQGGYTSFVLVSGIVVNGLLLILSDYRRLIKQYPDKAVIDLYIQAYGQKIIPILLTVISTALGLIPFTIHGTQEVFWFSLAVGTIGGLLFSVVVITFITPLTLAAVKNNAAGK